MESIYKGTDRIAFLIFGQPNECEHGDKVWVYHERDEAHFEYFTIQYGHDKNTVMYNETVLARDLGNKLIKLREAGWIPI
jgi:hypothetical protein